MDHQLTTAELQETSQLLQNYAPAQEALNTLKQHQGNLDASFNELWTSAVSTPETFARDGQSLWQATLSVLRDELCGDESFRSKILDYNKNPGSASLLTGAVITLIELTTLPLNPAMATIVVLYILKVGLNIFCKYTEPSPSKT
ncbi:hypothetical protein HRE53_22345 [Acaryochloris sp. 'Moss Beach']|uniref:hypothetical protein n=1 Tax=Acaryochloris sp. 'Moss Beach' TaxID=2740837 RepID=UPI001F354603|nr:hypothetical protein [Acaryochloris sp. 'Moss Beach']UJB69111.1 hypothetical protein HRE53_22345 [Acaryochloris sp. 'Moss Beach']